MMISNNLNQSIDPDDPFADLSSLSPPSAEMNGRELSILDSPLALQDYPSAEKVTQCKDTIKFSTSEEITSISAKQEKFHHFSGLEGKLCVTEFKDNKFILKAVDEQTNLKELEKAIKENTLVLFEEKKGNFTCKCFESQTNELKKDSYTSIEYHQGGKIQTIQPNQLEIKNLSQDEAKLLITAAKAHCVFLNTINIKEKGEGISESDNNKNTTTIDKSYTPSVSVSKQMQALTHDFIYLSIMDCQKKFNIIKQEIENYFILQNQKEKAEQLEDQRKRDIDHQLLKTEINKFLNKMDDIKHEVEKKVQTSESTGQSSEIRPKLDLVLAIQKWGQEVVKKFL
jgi:hypothetical protein